MGPLTITHDLTLFSDNQEYIGFANVKLGNDVGMVISHIGFASCVSPVTNIVLYLQNLLHVPTLNKNLLSVSKFANDNNVFFDFYSDSYYVKHQVTKQILFQGIIKDGLYIFPTLRSYPYSTNYTSFKFVAQQTWTLQFSCSQEHLKSM